MTDVDAVVLTLGEATTDAALAALRAQDVALRQVHVVRDVRPFHRAMNAGAARVAAPFFVQVDADMLLDPGCIAALRAHAAEDTAIVVGQLRDALIGRVVGVKLFRTAPFQQALMRDVISPDTELRERLRGQGWTTVYAGAPPAGDPEGWTTFGEHRRTYEAGYTHHKYLMEGRRYRYRDDPRGLAWHFGRLEASAHPAATVAQLALANGIFGDDTRDLLGTSAVDGGYARIATFLGSEAAVDFRPAPPAHSSASAATYAAWHEHGRGLFEAGAAPAFAKAVAALRGCDRSDARLVAKVGLCRGLLSVDARAVDAEYRVLCGLLSAQPPPPALVGLARRWRERLRRFARGRPR